MCITVHTMLPAQCVNGGAGLSYVQALSVSACFVQSLQIAARIDPRWCWLKIHYHQTDIL